MMKKLSQIIPALFILLQSCIVPTKSFVGTSFEPVSVKQKGDLEVSASIRPFKFYKLNATLAVNNGMAVRAGYSGFPGLNNADFSLIFFKKTKQYDVFIAPTYNYQNNSVMRDYGSEFLAIGRTFNYNCIYNSPGIALGCSRVVRKGNSRHWMLKISYNIVYKYSYYFTSNTASGRNDGYYVKDDETLDYKIGNFFSFEPSYSYMVSRPYRKMAVRFQIGFNLCQKVLIHKYAFSNKSFYNPQI